MSENIGMSSCCLSGALHGGTPTGRVDTIGGLQTYIAEPKNGSKAKTVVLISDSRAFFQTFFLPSLPLRFVLQSKY